MESQNPRPFTHVDFIQIVGLFVAGHILIVLLAAAATPLFHSDPTFALIIGCNPGVLQLFYLPFLYKWVKRRKGPLGIKTVVILASVLFIINGSCLALMTLGGGKI